MLYGFPVCSSLASRVYPPPSALQFAKGIADFAAIMLGGIMRIDEAGLRLTVPMFTSTPRNQGVRNAATGGCQ
jgi:hypothetical protein